MDEKSRTGGFDQRFPSAADARRLWRICGITSNGARLCWRRALLAQPKTKKARISASLQIVVPAPGVEPGTY